jgi:hypothetical protein
MGRNGPQSLIPNREHDDEIPSRCRGSESFQRGSPPGPFAATITLDRPTASSTSRDQLRIHRVYIQNPAIFRTASRKTPWNQIVTSSLNSFIKKLTSASIALRSVGFWTTPVTHRYAETLTFDARCHVSFRQSLQENYYEPGSRRICAARKE